MKVRYEFTTTEGKVYTNNKLFSITDDTGELGCVISYDGAPTPEEIKKGGKRIALLLQWEIPKEAEIQEQRYEILF